VLAVQTRRAIAKVASLEPYSDRCPRARDTEAQHVEQGATTIRNERTSSVANSVQKWQRQRGMPAQTVTMHTSRSRDWMMVEVAGIRVDSRFSKEQEHDCQQQESRPPLFRGIHSDAVKIMAVRVAWSGCVSRLRMAGACRRTEISACALSRSSTGSACRHAEAARRL